MAHELTDTDQMFSVRQMPWHGLGVILPEHPTRQEAQALVHGWEPITEPVYRKTPRIIDGELVETIEVIEGSELRVRSDNGEPLGVTPTTLGTIRNSELWDTVEAVGKIGSDLHIETAGSLRGGRDVWALMRFEEPLRVAGDTSYTVAYLALQNNHVGGGAFRAQAVNTRIVCANTSAWADTEAKRSGYEFNFRHSSGVSERLEEAKTAVRLWREGVENWQQVMEHLASVVVTEEQREEFVQRFQPYPKGEVSERVAGNIERARSEVRSILHSPTSIGIEFSAYGLFQAGLEWSQHYRSTRGADERSRMEAHFRRAMLTDTGLRRDTLALVREVAYA